jgi:hypothetical protein
MWWSYVGYACGLPENLLLVLLLVLLWLLLLSPSRPQVATVVATQTYSGKTPYSDINGNSKAIQNDGSPNIMFLCLFLEVSEEHGGFCAGLVFVGGYVVRWVYFVRAFG